MSALGGILAILAVGVFAFAGHMLGQKVRKGLYPWIMRALALILCSAVFCFLASFIASPIVDMIWPRVAFEMPDDMGGLGLVFVPVYIIGSVGSALANLEETLALWGVLTLVFLGMMGWQLFKRMPNAGGAT